MRNQSEDGLLRRVCALLSLPWISENETSSAYSSSGFPSWVLTLAQKLSSFYCEYSQLYSNINTICLQQNKKNNDILAQTLSLPVLFQLLRSRWIVSASSPFCGKVCVTHGVCVSSPKPSRIQKRWSELRRYEPPLFFFITWETCITTSSEKL